MNKKSPKRSRVKAQWGVDEHGEYEIRTIPDAVIAECAVRLKLNGGNERAVLAETLQNIDADYHREKEQYTRTPSRAASRAAIRDIGAHASQLADMMHSMDLETGWSLYIALRQAGDVEPDCLGQLFYDRLKADLRALARASGLAIGTLAEGSDKRSLIHVLNAVNRLVLLWERQTGQIFGFERDEDSGAPASIGGMFIVAVMRWIDEAASVVQIMTALRKIALSRKKISP